MKFYLFKVGPFLLFNTFWYVEHQRKSMLFVAVTIHHFQRVTRVQTDGAQSSVQPQTVIIWMEWVLLTCFVAAPRLAPVRAAGTGGRSPGQQLALRSLTSDLTLLPLSAHPPPLFHPLSVCLSLSVSCANSSSAHGREARVCDRGGCKHQWRALRLSCSVRLPVFHQKSWKKTILHLKQTIWETSWWTERRI